MGCKCIKSRSLEEPVCKATSCHSWTSSAPEPLTPLSTVSPAVGAVSSRKHERRWSPLRDSNRSRDFSELTKEEAAFLQQQKQLLLLDSRKQSGDLPAEQHGKEKPRRSTASVSTRSPASTHGSIMSPGSEAPSSVCTPRRPSLIVVGAAAPADATGAGIGADCETYGVLRAGRSFGEVWLDDDELVIPAEMPHPSEMANPTAMAEPTGSSGLPQRARWNTGKRRLEETPQEQSCGNETAETEGREEALPEPTIEETQKESQIEPSQTQSEPKTRRVSQKGKFKRLPRAAASPDSNDAQLDSCAVSPGASSPEKEKDASKEIDLKSAADGAADGAGEASSEIPPSPPPLPPPSEEPPKEDAAKKPTKKVVRKKLPGKAGPPRSRPKDSDAAPQRQRSSSMSPRLMVDPAPGRRTSTNGKKSSVLISELTANKQESPAEAASPFSSVFSDGSLYADMTTGKGDLSAELAKVPAVISISRPKESVNLLQNFHEESAHGDLDLTTQMSIDLFNEAKAITSPGAQTPIPKGKRSSRSQRGSANQGSARLSVSSAVSESGVSEACASSSSRASPSSPYSSSPGSQLLSLSTPSPSRVTFRMDLTSEYSGASLRSRTTAWSVPPNAAMALVMDIGSHTSKIGFGGDTEPRCVFSSVARIQRRTIVKAEHAMDTILSRAFSELGYEAQGNDKRPLLLTESPEMERNKKEALVQLLFETFDMPALHFESPAALALLSVGRSTGLVLDFGDAATYVTPIHETTPLGNVSGISSFGGKELTEYMGQLLKGQIASFPLVKKNAICTEVKETMTRVASKSFTRDSIGCESNPQPYTLPDGEVIYLQKNESIQCPEGLFEPSLLGKKQEKSVVQCAFDTVMRSDANLRKELFGNILLVGGTSLIPGLKERLTYELNDLVPAGMSVAIEAPPQRQNAAWLGGAILASLNNFSTMCFTKEEYEEVGPTGIHRRSV